MIKEKVLSIRITDSEYAILCEIANARYKGNVSKIVSGLITTYVGKVKYENK